MKDFLAVWLSVGAIVLDLLAGRGSRPRLFYSVVRASERFDRWINLHSVLEEMDALDTADGLFGASRAGDDSFVGKIEKLVRGAEEPLGTEERSSRGSGSGTGATEHPAHGKSDGT